MRSILILSFYYTPDLCAGSFRTAALIEALQPLAKQHNIHIDLYTTMPNRYAEFKMTTQLFESQENLSIYRISLPSHKSGFMDQARAFSRYFFQTKKMVSRKKYDLVFATSSRLFTAFLGARIASRKKIPLFLDMRDIFTDTMNSILPRYLKLFFMPLFKTVERYTIRHANALNLVSPGFKAYFSSKINSSCQMMEISNGIDLCFKNVYAQSNTDKTHGTCTILYAGNIGSGQAIEKIIPALATRFNNITEKKYCFRIIGGGGKLAALKNA